MKNLISKIQIKIRRFMIEKRGGATLEIVIIIAVLLAIALIFNKELRAFADKIFKKVFDDTSVIDQIKPGG